MPSDHESVAIAQTILYVPVVPITIYLLVKNWPIGPGMSRVPWLTLAILSLMRFTGGTLVIAGESDPHDLGLTIAMVVLLNVGLVPLIISIVGMIGIVLSSSNEKRIFMYKKMMITIRLLYVTAFSLLVAGAAISLDGNIIGDNLIQAAYVVFTVIISIAIMMILHLRFQKSKLAPSSLIYLHGATIAIPFLILRIVYALLSAFLAPNTWSPVTGAAVAFALMALLPEYITIAINMYLGFHRIRENALCSWETADNDGDQLDAHVQVIEMGLRHQDRKS